MRKAFQYRIFPTKKQMKILEQQLEACRRLYNETLTYRKDAWEQEQRNVSYFELKRRIPLLKAEHPELKIVYAQCLQNVTERVDLAFKAFFRRVKAGEEEPGYPRFKGYGRYDSLFLSQRRKSSGKSPTQAFSIGEGNT
jgi:putative transposase